MKKSNQVGPRGTNFERGARCGCAVAAAKAAATATAVTAAVAVATAEKTTNLFFVVNHATHLCRFIFNQQFKSKDFRNFVKMTLGRAY